MVTLPTTSAKRLTNSYNLENIDSDISPMIFENIKIFASQEQRFDSLRMTIFDRLNQLSKKIILNTKEWQEMNLEAKCTLLAEIQECLYDLQLVEHSSQMPVFALAKAVFSLNEKRCIYKAPIVKAKPTKKQKLENSSLTREARRVDSDIKSPSYLKVNEDALNNREQTEDSFTEQSSTKKASVGKRRSNRNEKTHLSNSLRLENNLVSEEKRVDLKNNDSIISRTENSIEKSDNAIEGSSKVEKKNLSNEEPVSTSAVDSAPPRRRAAALAAAVSVAETVNPQRSISPRKRVAAGNSFLNNADEETEGSSGTNPQDGNIDEPTYCLCEQVSFGDMICCDYAKCPIEWFHFSCVNIKIKPKGKKWFCPLCRGDKQTVLKSSLHSKR